RGHGVQRVSGGGRLRGGRIGEQGQVVLQRRIRVGEAGQRREQRRRIVVGRERERLHVEIRRESHGDVRRVLIGEIRLHVEVVVPELRLAEVGSRRIRRRSVLGDEERRGGI